jgi:hypothetical protein
MRSNLLLNDEIASSACGLIAMTPRSILHRCHNSRLSASWRESAPTPIAYASRMRERRFAFVLRLWIEDGHPNDAPLVRGSLQAAEADRVRYFTSVDDLPALLRDAIERAEPTPRSREEQS